MNPEYVRLEAMKLAVGLLQPHVGNMSSTQLKTILMKTADEIEQFVWSGLKKD